MSNDYFLLFFGVNVKLKRNNKIRRSSQMTEKQKDRETEKQKERETDKRQTDKKTEKD